MGGFDWIPSYINKDTCSHDIMASWLNIKRRSLAFLLVCVLSMIGCYVVYNTNPKQEARLLPNQPDWLAAAFAQQRPAGESPWRYKNNGGPQNVTYPTKDMLLTITQHKNVHRKAREMKLEIPFLPTYKNPCWYETLPDEVPYRQNVWTELDTFNQSLRIMVPLMETRKRSGQGWRLRCLPYVYIAGVAKCGTSDLYQTLIKHPEVAGPAVKEPTFWNNILLEEDGERPNAKGNLSFFQKQRHNVIEARSRSFRDYVEIYDMPAEEIRKNVTFYSAPQGGVMEYHNKITVDATPSYFFGLSGLARTTKRGPQVPEVTTPDFIHALTPRAKVILIIRNPTDRLFSDYKFFGPQEDLSLQDFHDKAAYAIQRMKICLRRYKLRGCIYAHENVALTLLARVVVGMYQPFLRDWFKAFSRENVLVLRLEDYASNTNEVSNEVFEFLGLQKYSIEKDKIINAARGSPFAKLEMRQDTRRMIDEFYKPWNQRLAVLLNDPKFAWET